MKVTRGSRTGNAARAEVEALRASRRARLELAAQCAASGTALADLIDGGHAGLFVRDRDDLRPAEHHEIFWEPSEKRDLSLWHRLSANDVREWIASGPEAWRELHDAWTRRDSDRQAWISILARNHSGLDDNDRPPSVPVETPTIDVRQLAESLGWTFEATRRHVDAEHPAAYSARVVAFTEQGFRYLLEKLVSAGTHSGKLVFDPFPECHRVGESNEGRRAGRPSVSIGDAYGEGTVLARVQRPNDARHVWWRLGCSCGNGYESPGDDLLAGRVLSCGHLAEANRRRRSP
jgi:hypothetical protein